MMLLLVVVLVKVAIRAKNCIKLRIKLVCDRPTYRPTDQSLDNVTYEVTIAARNCPSSICFALVLYYHIENVKITILSVKNILLKTINLHCVLVWSITYSQI